MGRKSKTKKIVREILEEKAKKGRGSALFDKLSKPQSKKALKKQVNKRSHKKTEKKPAKPKQTQALVPVIQKEKLHHRLHRHFKKHRRSIYGGLLATIMISLLVCIAYLLFSKAFRADPIAKLLPADSTVAVLELNTNFDHSQIVKAFDLLKKYPQYSKDSLIKAAETALTMNYEIDLKPWLGRSVAMVLFNTKDSAAPGIGEAYFAEYISKDELMKFITAHSTADKRVYQNYEIFNLDTKYFATIIGSNLALSLEENTISEIINQQTSKTPSLYDSAKYRKVEENLPSNEVAFGFIDYNNIEDSFFERFSFLSEKGITVSVIAPFVKIFDAEGAALIADDNNLEIQTYSSLAARSDANSDLLLSTENYEATLSGLVKKDAVIFWGAQDLSGQFKRMINIFSEGQSSVITVFNKVLNNYVKKYFGETVTLEEGILPLLTGEFAFAVEPGPESENAYKVLFTLVNGKAGALKLQDLATQFASVGAIFAPKVVERTLPDGTVTKEIIAVPEKITSSQSVYKDATIYAMQAGAQGWSIYYAFVGNNVVIATTSQSVKDSIDLFSQPAESLKSSAGFASSTSLILGSSSELSYFNIQAIAPLLLGKTPPPDLLKILDTVSSGKTYTSEGITTINYLNLK